MVAIGSQAATILHVTAGKPGSLDSALDALRALKSSNTRREVHLEGGTHYLRRTLELDETDSGATHSDIPSPCTHIFTASGLHKPAAPQYGTRRRFRGNAAHYSVLTPANRDCSSHPATMPTPLA